MWRIVADSPVALIRPTLWRSVSVRGTSARFHVAALTFAIEIEVLSQRGEVETQQVHERFICSGSAWIGRRCFFPRGCADEHAFFIQNDRAFLRSGVMETETARGGNSHFTFQFHGLLFKGKKTPIRKIRGDSGLVRESASQITPSRRVWRKLVLGIH